MFVKLRMWEILCSHFRTVANCARRAAEMDPTDHQQATLAISTSLVPSM